MVHVLASIEIKSSHQKEFLKHFKENIPKVKAEAGCIEYQPCIDLDTEIPVQVKNGNVVTVIEKWESLKHLEAHLIAPHMLSYKEKVQDMIISVSLKVLKNA